MDSTDWLLCKNVNKTKSLCASIRSNQSIDSLQENRLLVRIAYLGILTRGSLEARYATALAMPVSHKRGESSKRSRFYTEKGTAKL